MIHETSFAIETQPPTERPTMRVVHVGFPKTATTFLQTRVFSRLPLSFAYFDKWTSAPLFAPLMDHDDTLFDAHALANRLQAAWQDREKCLFSYEPLTGLHYQSGFVNRTQIARRLKDAGFDRAIITIRNQFDALDSAYRQHVKSGGVLKFDDYVQFDRAKAQYLYPEYFDYASIYGLYASTFGRGNVLVLQHENLHTAAFREELCRFLEIERIDVDAAAPVNVSLSRAKTAALRLINHLTYNAYRPSHLVSRRLSTDFFHRRLAAIPFWNDRRSFVDPAKRQVVAAFYQGSNRRLQDDAKIVLAPEYP